MKDWSIGNVAVSCKVSPKYIIHIWKEQIHQLLTGKLKKIRHHLYLCQVMRKVNLRKLALRLSVTWAVEPWSSKELCSYSKARSTPYSNWGQPHNNLYITSFLKIHYVREFTQLTCYHQYQNEDLLLFIHPLVYALILSVVLVKQVYNLQR